MSVIPDFTLRPGERIQLNRVLRGTGIGDGYAVVDRMSGSGRFVAYAAVNDNVTNDATIFPMTAVR